jgi:hypothetical protein
MKRIAKGREKESGVRASIKPCVQNDLTECEEGRWKDGKKI